jgi:hypothetical protein
VTADYFSASADASSLESLSGAARQTWAASS